MGETHASVAVTLINMGLIRRKQGDEAAAATLNERAAHINQIAATTAEEASGSAAAGAPGGSSATEGSEILSHRSSKERSCRWPGGGDVEEAGTPSCTVQ